jgi:hypothetical protein
MPSPLDLQCVNVKLFVEKAAGQVDLEPLIPLFHNWIQEQVFDELLIDVADYRHVPAGPGVMLIGHQADYSVDNKDDRLGVRYNRKARLEGSNQERLAQAARSALKACQKLEADQRLQGGLRFNGREIELFINDRALAPNSEATRAGADPEFQSFCKKLLGGAEYTLCYDQERRHLFGAVVKASKPFSVAELLANLGKS